MFHPKVSDMFRWRTIIWPLSSSSLERKPWRSSELALPHDPFAPWPVDLQELSPPWNLTSQKYPKMGSILQPNTRIWPATTGVLKNIRSQQKIGFWLAMVEDGGSILKHIDLYKRRARILQNCACSWRFRNHSCAARPNSGRPWKLRAQWYIVGIF